MKEKQVLWFLEGYSLIGKKYINRNLHTIQCSKCDNRGIKWEEMIKGKMGHSWAEENWLKADSRQMKELCVAAAKK